MRRLTLRGGAVHWLEIHVFPPVRGRDRSPRALLSALRGPLSMTVRAMPVMLGVLAVLAVAYRYYSAFLAARVAALNDANKTPAHQYYDGQNFHPTNRW